MTTEVLRLAIDSSRAVRGGRQVVDALRAIEDRTQAVEAARGAVGALAGEIGGGLVRALGRGANMWRELRFAGLRALGDILARLIRSGARSAFGGGNLLSHLAGSAGLDLPGFAGGGAVRGPGGGRSDSVLARLSNGEFVVNAAEARRHGELLRAINGGGMPHFAEGGPVKAFVPTATTPRRDRRDADAGRRPVNVVVNVAATDVASFQRSRGQIAAEAAQAIRRATRDL